MLKRWKATEPLRLYVYGLVAPVMAALILYGVLSSEEAAAWAGIAAAVLLPAGAEAARAKVSPVRHR